MFASSRLPALKAVLALDGIVGLASGAVLAGFSSALAGPLGLSEAFVLWVGVALLPIGAFMLAVATRPVPPPAGVAIVVGGNVAWVIASVAILVVGLVEPTGLGVAVILGQAVAVAGIAAVEAAAARQRPDALRV